MRAAITIEQILKTACGGRNEHLKGQVEKKRSKFNNVKVYHEGEEFDSVKERSRHITNQYRQQIGEIKNLQRQVRFHLESSNKKVCDYIADSTYNIVSTGEFVVEDVKSPATRRLATYRIKKKLMAAQYKIEIKEI